jgi:hypothetical protein
MMTQESLVSDAPNCSISYDRHSDNCRGVIYAPGAFNYAPRNIYCTSITHDDFHIFIVQAEFSTLEVIVCWPHTGNSVPTYTT